MLVVSWLRRPDQRERDRGGWVEQARQSTFAAHTGATCPPTDAADRIDFDDEDANRERYNRWLASMADREPQSDALTSSAQRTWLQPIRCTASVSQADAVRRPAVGSAASFRWLRPVRRRRPGPDAGATVRSRSSSPRRRTSTAPTPRRCRAARRARQHARVERAPRPVAEPAQVAARAPGSRPRRSPAASTPAADRSSYSEVCWRQPEIVGGHVPATGRRTRRPRTGRGSASRCAGR